MNSIMVVADLYQLSKIEGNTFDMGIEYAKKKKTSAVVERAYVERINNTSAKSGKKWVIDESATKEWQTAIKNKKDARVAQEKFEKLNSANALSDILSLAKSIPEAPKEEVKPVVVKEKKEVSELSEPNEESSIEDIKAYLDANEIKYHHKIKDKSKLLELI